MTTGSKAAVVTQRPSSAHTYTFRRLRSSTPCLLLALPYNLGNFLHRLALPASVAQWSMATEREKLIKIGAKVVRIAGYMVFQMDGVALQRSLCRTILDPIPRLRPAKAASGFRAFCQSLDKSSGGGLRSFSEAAERII